MRHRRAGRTRGFTLIELMVALAILMIVCGVAFEMLTLAMKRYHADSQLLNTFQEARFGLDQMVRDINDAGYPPRSSFQESASPSPSRYAVTPFAWGGNSYPLNPCSIGVTCPNVPNGYDIIIETDIDPQNNNGVEWVRYKLQNNILYRGVYQKSSIAQPDPVVLIDASTVMVPYVQNVMNNPAAGEMADLQAAYPNMFPGGNPVPVFQYFCESTPQPIDCTSTSPPPSTNDPKHVVAVGITLIVQAPTVDMQTGHPLVVQLKGLGRRVNPDY